jgi:predicted permease
MTRMRRMFTRVRALFSKERLDRELDEEVRCHLEMIAEEKVRRGMDPDGAMWEARREFGGLEQTKEAYRDARGLPWLETLIQDACYAGRIMRRQPGLTAAVVLALGLGIGANTSVFSILNTLFLRPLPYPDAERLVLAGEVRVKEDQPGALGAVRYLNFVDWRERGQVFESMAAIRMEPLNVNHSGEPDRVEGERVSEDFFRVLGMKPALGRTLQAEDYSPGAARAMVISDRYWRTAFGGRPDVIGQTVRIEGSPATVTGVMPPRFRSALLEGSCRFWIPLIPQAGEANREARSFTVIGRLRRDVTLDQARTEMAAVAQRLAEEFPASNREWGVHLDGMQDHYVQGASSALSRLLAAAAGLLLLLACANAANLLLVRGIERQKEIALRVAMGASRTRVVRQLMIENLLNGLLGGGAGLVLATWMTSALSGFAVMVSGDRRFEMDGRVLGFALLASAGTALIFGVLPAIRGSRVDLTGVLKEGGTGQMASASRRRFSSGLVVAQITLSLMLLITAGFVLKSIYGLWRFDWGFPTENRMSFGVAPQSRKYSSPGPRLQFYEDLLARAKGLPGVKSAALAGSLPIELVAPSVRVEAEGRSGPLMATYRIVSPDYPRVLAIPVKKGRAFSSEDTATSPLAAMVSESLARAAWGDGDPIGQVITVGGARRAVVGVTADVVNQGLLKRPGYEVIVPHTQDVPASATLIVHAAGDAAAMAGPLRKAVATLDSEQAVYAMKTLEAAHAEICRPLEFVLLLLSIFAAIAMTLAVVGVYALTAHSVATRARDIGIRMAMGASRRRVLAEMVGRGLRLTLAGLILGSAAAFVSVRLLLTKVWWLGPTGPAVVCAVAGLLGLAALIACYFPALRATRIDPSAALRAE